MTPGWCCILRNIRPVHTVDVQGELLTHRVAHQVRLVEDQVGVLAEFSDPNVFVAGIFDTLILEDGVTSNTISIWREINENRWLDKKWNNLETTIEQKQKKENHSCNHLSSICTYFLLYLLITLSLSLSHTHTHTHTHTISLSYYRWHSFFSLKLVSILIIFFFF